MLGFVIRVATIGTAPPGTSGRGTRDPYAAVLNTMGVYSVVRHPGYATWMVQALSMPFLFSSLWTFIPVGLLIVMFFIRTTLEDRTLLDELEGYREYATRVRSRLIPGIW